MAITLATPFVLPNGARLMFPNWIFDDDHAVWTVPYELLPVSAQGRRIITRGVLYIRNGTCSRMARKTPPTPGVNLDDPTYYFLLSERDVPTGYSDASVAAHAGGNTPESRRPALEAHLYAAGHIDASLAGV